MAKRYSDHEKKKHLRKVQALHGQGLSLSEARQKVADSKDGPSVASLANWEKDVALEDGVGTATFAELTNDTEQQDKPVVSETLLDHSDVEEADEPSTSEPAGDDDTILDDTPLSVSEAVATSEPGSAQFAGSASGNGHGAATLVHVPSADVEVLVDENRHLRRELDQANREIRALRDLLVVYASR